VPETELPLTLPETDNFKPSGSPESPLANVSDWVSFTDPKTGARSPMRALPLSQHNHHSSAVEILQLWCHLCITISPKSVQAHSLTTHLAVPVCELGGSSAVMTHVVWQLLLAPWMVCWLLDACVKRARCILNREEVSEGDLYNAPMGRLLLVLPQISSAMEHRAACGP